MRQLLAAACLACSVAGHGAGLDPLREQLAAPIAELQGVQTVRGRFEQTKTLSGFERPLVSRGAFLQVRGHGVVWRTLEPIQAEMVLGRERVQGLPGAEGGAAARALSEIFTGLFELDLDRLAQRFEVSAAPVGEDEDWALSLVPRDAALKDVVAHVRVAGRQTVEHVRLEDALGDVTAIALQDVVLDREAPAPEALLPFGP